MLEMSILASQAPSGSTHVTAIANPHTPDMNRPASVGTISPVFTKGLMSQTEATRMTRVKSHLRSVWPRSSDLRQVQAITRAQGRSVHAKLSALRVNSESMLIQKVSTVSPDIRHIRKPLARTATCPALIHFYAAVIAFQTSKIVRLKSVNRPSVEGTDPLGLGFVRRLQASPPGLLLSL